MITIDLTIRGCTTEEAAKFISAVAAANGSTSTGALTIHAPSNIVPGNIVSDDDAEPANPNAPAFDSAGIPWDERIHSSKRNTNADGTWRKRRGVDAATISAVENELKARGSQPMYMPPQNVQQPVYSPPTNNIPMPPPQPIMQQPVQQYAPQPQPIMQQPVQQYAPQPQPIMQQPVQQYAPQPMDLNGFMAHLSGQMAKRDAAGMPLINAQYLANVAQELSQQLARPINHIAEIGNDPNAIQAAVNILMRDGRWQ